jgi:hypothetical protein
MGLRFARESGRRTVIVSVSCFQICSQGESLRRVGASEVNRNDDGAIGPDRSTVSDHRSERSFVGQGETVGRCKRGS